MEQGLSISTQTYKRLPLYYTFLKSLSERDVEAVSAPTIAKALNLNEVQVRKDLAAVSKSGGRPRKGFNLNELLSSIRLCLGHDIIDDAVLVGAGQLGRALLSYRGFEENGVRIVAAFDANPDLAGLEIGGKTVFPLDRLEELVRQVSARIAIITVPENAAQAVCDRLIQTGIRAIWNFAPVHLNVPKGVIVRNENMGASVAMLAKELAESDRASEQ